MKEKWKRFLGCILTVVFLVTALPAGSMAAMTPTADCDHLNIVEDVYDEATCTQTGRVMQVCEQCGLQVMMDVPALGHAFDYDFAAFPTCTQEGLQVGCCSRCGYTEEETAIPALGHDWDVTVVVQPTCTTEGQAKTYCMRCYEEQESVVLPMTPHTLGDPVITKTPSCEEEGTRTYTCTVCGYEENDVLPALGHNYTESTVIKEPTCKEPGKRGYTCLTCGKTVEEEIPAVDHKLGAYQVVKEATDFAGGIEEAVCEVCGEAVQRGFLPDGILKKGDNNDAVRSLQEQLNAHGFDCGEPDGGFGDKTETAVKAFQESAGFTADGIAWPGVVKALTLRLSIVNVRNQKSVNENGDSVGIDLVLVNESTKALSYFVSAASNPKCEQHGAELTLTSGAGWNETVLQPGESAACSYEILVDEKDVSNGVTDFTFVVTGTDPEGNTVVSNENYYSLITDSSQMDQTPAPVQPADKNSSLSLNLDYVDGMKEVYGLGDTFTVYFTVRNNGEQNLNQFGYVAQAVDMMYNPVEFVHEMAPVDQENWSTVQLAAGESQICKYTASIDQLAVDKKQLNLKFVVMAMDENMNAVESNECWLAVPVSAEGSMDNNTDTDGEAARPEAAIYIERVSAPETAEAVLNTAVPITWKVTNMGETVVDVVNVQVDDGACMDTSATEFYYLPADACWLEPGASVEVSGTAYVSGSDLADQRLHRGAVAEAYSYCDDKGSFEVDVNSNLTLDGARILCNAAYANVDLTGGEDEGSLKLVKSVANQPENGTFFTVGETVSFELKVQNGSGHTYQNGILTDQLMQGESKNPGSYASIAPGEELTYTFDYTVTEMDAENGSVTNIAYLVTEDERGHKILFESNEVSVDAGLKDNEITAFDMPSMSMVKYETSTPANGLYYEEGEVIHYTVSLVNDGNTTIGEAIANDFFLDLGSYEIGYCELFNPSVVRSFYVNHTVSKLDTDLGFAVSFAYASATDEEFTVYSNLVFSPCGRESSEAEREEIMRKTGRIEPLVGKKKNYSSCVRTLTAKGIDSLEYERLTCKDHMKTAKEVKDLIGDAQEDELKDAWYSAADLWKEEIRSLYDQALANASDVQTKAIIMEERDLFFRQAVSFGKSVLQITGNEVAAAKAKADLMEDKCVDLCYELHNAQEEHPAGYGHDHDLIREKRDPADCTENMLSRDRELYQYECLLCEDHENPDSIICDLLEISKTPEAIKDVWTRGAKLWKTELTSMQNERYGYAEDETAKAIVVEDRTAFENWITAREKFLNVLYPDHPEISAEVTAKEIMNRVLDYCGYMAE